MDRSKRFVYPLILVAALLLVPTSAFADLMQPVTITWYYPDLSTILGGSTDVAVGDSFTCSGQAGTVCQEHPDTAFFEVNNHSLVFWTPGQIWGDSTYTDPYNGYVFSGLDFGPGIYLTGYTLTTNIPNLDAEQGTRVAFGSDYIQVDLRGLATIDDGEGGQLPGGFTLSLHASDEPSGVPEPGTMSLLFGGLVLAGGCRFLRRRA